MKQHTRKAPRIEKDLYRVVCYKDDGKMMFVEQEGSTLITPLVWIVRAPYPVGYLIGTRGHVRLHPEGDYSIPEFIPEDREVAP